MFRCPTNDCRQAQVFKVIGCEDIELRIDEDYKLTVFQVNSNTIISDPTVINTILEGLIHDKVRLYCPKCKEEYSIFTVIDAFNKPMAMFETSNLCNCGGEIWEDVVPIKSETIASNIPQAIKFKNIHKCERCNKEY